MNADSQLPRLRGEIDRIDNQLLDLIERRLLLSSAIASAKEGSADLYLRPKRQRELVGRLQDRATLASPDAIRHIWRELMSHSLQVQARCPFLFVRCERAELLVRLVREQFGSAGRIEWTDSMSDALARASTEQLVAVVPHDTNIQVASPLKAFQLLNDDAGVPVAWAIGRIAEDDEKRPARKDENHWTPGGWRNRSSAQLPIYPDDSELRDVERRLAKRAPIVEYNDVLELSRRLGDVAKGQAVILQAGDCAEQLTENPGKTLRSLTDLLNEMAFIIAAASSREVVRIGRVAGQLAKPRTRLTELIEGVTVPTYRGDAINGVATTDRIPDPSRLLLAHAHSDRAARWLTDNVSSRSTPLYTSHEALLLNYEEALTHFDELSSRWWSYSGHLLWMGDRTRELDGAHIEYLRGIANPIAIKCGPSLEASELLGLLATLDPLRTPGRLTLIPRLGHRGIGSRLPSLMRAAASEGWRVPWLIDPMHGNTQLVGNVKTRYLDHIRAEISAFFAIVLAENAWPGGVHLELTPEDVTECIDGRRVTTTQLGDRYTTACDPRLNREQALEIAGLIAEQYRRYLQCAERP